MAKQEILISINVKGADVASKSTKQFGQAVDGVTKAQQDYFKALQPNNLQIEKYKILTAEATAATRAKAIAELNAAEATRQGRTQSGLNNAILLETGRLASDASYGFTAIANNLSQVVTLFSSFVKTQGSVAESFKELGRSLLGTGGLLIGVQLLISFGPKIVEFLKNLGSGSQLLRETFQDAGSQVQDSAGKFETYIGTLESATKSSAEKEKAIKKLNKEFPDYIKSLNEAGISLDDVKNGTDAAKQANDKYRDSLLELAMARAAQNKIDELAAEQLQAEIDFKDLLTRKGYEVTEQRYQEILAEREAVKEKNKSSAQQVKQIGRIGTAEERRYVNARQRFEEAQKNLEEQVKTLVEYTKIEDEENKKRGRSQKERVRIFKEADLDYEKEILASQQRIEKLENKHQLDLLDIQLRGMAEKASLKQKEFEEDQARRLKDFLLSEATLEEKAEAERRYNNSVAESRASLGQYLNQLDQEYVAKSSDIKEQQELDDISKFGKLLGDFNTERLSFQEEYLSKYTDSEIDRVGVAKQIEADRFAGEMSVLDARLAAAEANGESTYAIEQEILNATQANTEARIKLAEDERRAKIAISNQVGEAILTVAGEGSTVGKAASIAMAIMNTKEAFTAALGAKPYGFWNIAQAASVLAMGMKQVKDIKNTKIPGKEPSTAGADSAAGSVIQAPDFNVVGASEQSQLAQAVSTAQQQPVRAFVVGKDITTQQELDRNVTNTASFG